MKKLLLHICCAPCLIYPLQSLKDKGFEVTGFFYNPNVHSFNEYKNRKTAVENFSKGADVEMIYPDYIPADYFRAVNLKEETPARCSICWSLRLMRTAWEAKKRGFAYFSTTLLVSPYQDQASLKKIGDDIAQAEGVSFYYEDFRPGFKEAHDQARAQGIYCQKYCGCIFSEIERCKKSAKH